MALSKTLKIVLVFVLLISSALNATKMHNALLTGKEVETFIKPQYGFMKSPENLPDNASSKFGADFMCLYFSAKGYNSTGTMYDDNNDPWKRTAFTFPPNLIYFTSKLVQYFNFTGLLFLNLYFQIILFAIVTTYFLMANKVKMLDITLCNSFLLFMIFCTPSGLSWLERGQTDIYTAIALLFFLKGLLDEKWWDFFLAGIMLTFKWAGIPYFVFFSISWLLINPISIKKLINLTLAAAPTFLICLPFKEQTLIYLTELKRFELIFHPDGISLVRHFPRPIAKILPFIQILLFKITSLSKKLDSRIKMRIEFIFTILICYVASGYGTLAFEYRIVALLALVPILLVGKLPITKTKINYQDKFIIYSLIAMVIYIFKVETNFEAINYIMNYKRGRLPFNFLTIYLLYYTHVGFFKSNIEME